MGAQVVDLCVDLRSPVIIVPQVDFFVPQVCVPHCAFNGNAALRTIARSSGVHPMIRRPRRASRQETGRMPSSCYRSLSLFAGVATRDSLSQRSFGPAVQAGQMLV